MVVVGPEEKRYTLHKAIISNHSKFFKAACSKAWVNKGKEKIIRLPTVDVEAFEYYTQWAYSGEIVVATKEELAAAADTSTGLRGKRLAKLYVAGEYLGDSLLRNAVIDRLHETHIESNHGPGIDEINVAYEGTSAPSTLRRLIVDYFVAYNHASLVKWCEEAAEELPKEFFSELAFALARADFEKTKPEWEAGDCTYHEHNADVPSCA